MVLKPAVLYKEEILEKSKELFYTDNMVYYSGTLISRGIDIPDESDEHDICYAIIDDKSDDHLVGLISFSIDWYGRNAYNFGLISFDSPNPVIGWGVKRVMNMLINEWHIHRIEFRCIGGNPVKKHYDRFCKKLGGRVLELKDVFKDRQGNYHNDYIYEILL